jgi:hypothetical protein
MPDKDRNASEEINQKFKALWHRALQLPKLNDLSAETVTAWAVAAGLNVQDVAKKQVGPFRPIPALALTVEGVTAYFPTVSANDDPDWLVSRRAHDRIAAIWSKVEWFEPLWVARGKIGPLLAAVEHRTKGDAIRQFDYHTSNDGNFRRLIVALATFGVIESWHDESNAVSLFFPEMSDDSILLWQQAQLQVHGQYVLRMLEQQNYQKYGQIVPPRPTDDGVLLRKAHLLDECVKDLVRPLRDAGRNVEMGEPDDRALQIKVTARSGEEKVEVGLLFSCGTDTSTYQALAKSCIAILYLGPPFKQEEFARGIDVHVGPVAGWQPPRAPI